MNLKENHNTAKLRLIKVTSTLPFPDCRTAPFQAKGSPTVLEYIAKAFNDEFKIAGVYSETDVEITGEITNIAFESAKNTFWDIHLELTSPNGKKLTIKEHREFEWAYVGNHVCANAADALRSLIRNLITKTINHPKFPELWNNNIK